MITAVISLEDAAGILVKWDARPAQFTKILVTV